jgi:hypothetical protein
LTVGDELQGGLLSETLGEVTASAQVLDKIAPRQPYIGRVAGLLGAATALEVWMGLPETDAQFALG